MCRNKVRLLRWSPDEKERIGELIRTLVVEDEDVPMPVPSWLAIFIMVDWYQNVYIPTLLGVL